MVPVRCGPASEAADTDSMTYLVVRWNADTRTYTTLNLRFETYSEAEEYASNRHVEAEETAKIKASRHGRYAPNLYKFMPMSAAQHAKVIGPDGRRKAR